MSGGAQSPRISVVIPCYGDRAAALECARRVSGHPHCREVVIADATPGDWDSTLGENVRVVACPDPGRGRQLATGAAACDGDLLVFNHADTGLLPVHLDALVDAWGMGARAGAFHRAFAKHHPKLAFLQPVVRWWGPRFGVLYGDQSVFVSREVYRDLGGFRALPLMEDVEFSDRLRKRGGLVLLDPPVATSMRRFRAGGYLKTKIQNLAYLFLFRAGVSPERLYRWYYR